MVTVGFSPGSNAKSADFEEAADAYRRNDFFSAIEMLLPLAEEGDARAQTVLALMYKYGEGVEQDLEAAFSWYRKAAELNYAPAQFHTGTMLADGRGTPKDEGEAVSWLTKAAESGFERANEKLQELNVSYVESKAKVENYVEWSRNWDLNLPNDIRFPPPSTADISDARFRAQLGAMSTRQSANALQQKLIETDPSLFDGLSFTIIESRQNKVIYRLQAGPFASIETTRFFCNRLNQSLNTGCLPLQTLP